MHPVALAFATASALALTAVGSHAAIIFISYNDSDGGTPSPLNNNSGKAVAFTMPTPLQPTDTASYQLNSLTFRFSGSVTNTQIVVKLYSNDGSNTPGTELTAFSSDTFTLTTTAGSYTFVPAGSVTLLAGLKYWATVSSTEPSGGAALSWRTSTAQPASYSDVGVTPGGQIFGTGSDPSTWPSSSGVINTVTVDATALPVPEPAAALLLAGGAMTAAVKRRRMR